MARFPQCVCVCSDRSRSSIGKLGLLQRARFWRFARVFRWGSAKSPRLGSRAMLASGGLPAGVEQRGFQQSAEFL